VVNFGVAFFGSNRVDPADSAALHRRWRGVVMDQPKRIISASLHQRRSARKAAAQEGAQIRCGDGGQPGK